MLKILCSVIVVGQSLATASRQLSEPPIAGYVPKTDVTDHLVIDLDQQFMEVHLKDGDFDGAISIYNSGAFSRPFATLHIPALTEVVPNGLSLKVVDDDQNTYLGTAMEEALVGSTQIMFLYQTGNCQVGGLNFNSQTIHGCLPESGLLQIAARGEVAYSYHAGIENSNDRTLAGFSTSARSKMHDCGVTCPYVTYSKFQKYYENFEYGNAFVLAAYEGKATRDLARGQMDFSEYSEAARAEVMKKSSAYMNVWMYVIREMEAALDECQVGCVGNCNNDAVHHWDEAVAFYTGSLEGQQGTGDGVLMHALADKRCQNFKTCGVDGKDLVGRSQVNTQVWRAFQTAQADLENGLCTNARKHKETIEALMAVPLVQGTLRYAWITDFEQKTSTDKEEAEGAAFAAAVLPLVHACNENDAEFIYDNMRAGFGDPDFKGIKAAFENNYKCMGISCADVGGLWDEVDRAYLDDASPCGDGGVKNQTAAIVGGVLGGICFALICVIVWLKCNKSSSSGKDPSFVAGSTTEGGGELPIHEGSEIQ